MQNEINAWLNGGCNYANGVALYQQFGTDNFLKRQLAKAETSFNRSKLMTALTALRDAASSSQPILEPVTNNLEKKTIPPSPEIQTAAPTGPIPELMKASRDRNANLAQIRSLHPYLHTLPEGEQLRKVAMELVMLGAKNAELHHRYQHILQHGHTEELKAPEPEVLIDVTLLNNFENLRKSLSAAKKRLREQTDPNPKTIELIKEKKTQLAALKEQITKLKAGGKP